MARLVDTNILVYAYDWREPDKQRIAWNLLFRSTESLTVCLPHQAIVEFVAVTTRPRADLNGRPLLSREEAYREAEAFLSLFVILYPNVEILTLALDGAVRYQLSWFDAHLWAYAEHFGLTPLISEDFQHGRSYGSVRVENPFMAEVVNEPYGFCD